MTELEQREREAQGDVFRLRDGWHLRFDGKVPSVVWADKGAAEAQLDLLRKGYSIITSHRTIKHIGAQS